jgi:small-conductance mechanosensitive channel
MSLDFIRNWFDSSVILGNTPQAYGIALVAFGAALAILYIVKNVGIARMKAMAEKTETDLDDFAVTLVEKIRWFEYQLAAFYVATRYLQRTPAFEKALKLLILLVFTYRAITMAQDMLSYWIGKLTAKRDLSQEAKASIANSMQVIMRALVWIAAVLFVLENMGVNISAVLTGLGIGGVAVALAAQAILGDIFNFFVILLDKPFHVGDFVVNDALAGTIEHIGLKSTRIRSLSGELVVVSNSKLLGKELKNYKKMQRRRVALTVSVTYETPLEKLKLLPSLIKDILTGLEKATFDHCNLSAMASSSIDFETVYYVESPDYNFHMQLQERFWQAVIEKCGQNGIDFPYPTQTLYIKK